MKLKQAAFTLVESVVAVAILSLVLVSVYGVFFSVLRSTETGAAAAIEVQRQRIVLKTIEDALSGLIYYEQNKDIYYFSADTEDTDYQSISFVSRVPPDFLGNNLFGSERVRRITFQVEDDESGGRVLVMYQTSILDMDQSQISSNQSSLPSQLDTQNIPDSQRWILGKDLDLFWLQFWSTKDNQWMVEWIEPDAPQPPARIRVELAYKRDDGLVTLVEETQKREMIIFSESITQAMQNPTLPQARNSGSRGGRPSGRPSSSSRKPPTAEQIAAWRKKREEDARRRERENDGKRKLPEGSRRVSDYGRMQNTAKKYDANGDGILDSGERAKWRADWAASNKNSQSSGGSRAAGSASNTGGSNTGGSNTGGSNTGGSTTGGSNTGGGGAPRSGGPSVLPGALILNGELSTFEARTLQELVDMGVYDSMEDLQATAPEGAVWDIDPDTGLVVPIYP